MGAFTMPLDEVIEILFNESSNPDDWEQPYHAVTFENVTYGRLPTVPDWNKLGLGSYPIFAEGYREILNGKIVDEYFKREIGVETIDMFQLTMRRKMDQIMPYWNKIYETEKIPYSALQTMDIHSLRDANVEENGEGVSLTKIASTTDTSGRAVTQQTPQTILQNNADYATGASDSKGKSEANSENDQESTSSNSTQSNEDNRVTGFQGVSSDLVNRYRASLLNIDLQIMRDIETCFMLMLDNGDSYFNHRNWIF